MADVSRGLIETSTSKSIESTSLLANFNTMLNNVNQMIKKNGPIYSCWIYFQLGIKEPIVFNTSSNDKDKNLIASLNVKKGSSGCANDFTLTVRYDPFNFGQETKDKIEALDDYIGDAMNVDWDSEEDQLQGILQYGYNSTGNNDDRLVSPKYRFYLTNADSNIKFDSGIGEYTFEGVSSLSRDCDFSATFTAVTNWKPLDIVIWTLFYYYGDANKIPNGLAADSKPAESAAQFGYAIDISEDLVNDQQREEISIEEQSGMSPWAYCSKILADYPLTQSNIDSGNYDDLSNMNYDEIPRYIMWITDNADGKTIHIAHNTPKESPKNTKVDYDFTWSTQDKNLVVEWNPAVDLYLYLIMRSQYGRVSEQLENSGIDVTNSSDNGEGTDIDRDVQHTLNDKLKHIDQDRLKELYDATLTTVGIPADPPLASEVRVLPRVLESVSRTAGVYIITDCEDSISTNGTYTTQFKLFRVRKINEESWASQNSAKTQEEATKTQEENKTNNTSGTSTSTDSMQRWRDRLQS